MGSIHSLIAAVFIVSTTTYGATAIDADKFIKSVEGSYDIVRAGGEAPHADNALADVYADTDEGAFTLPYCPPGEGQCDPGYLFFPYAQTTVSQEQLADGSVVSTLEKGGKTYTWTDKNGTVVFRNPQYSLGGKTTVLEHILTRPNLP
jgi:hypothetical protein